MTAAVRKKLRGGTAFPDRTRLGDADTPLSAEAILTREKTKTWETVRDLLKGDDAILAVLSYGDLYHNLKAAIKDAAAPGSHGNVYFDDCEVDGVRMAKIVAEKDWQALRHIAGAAKEASETFLHTSDGQLAISSLTGRRSQLSMSAERNASDAIIRRLCRDDGRGGGYQDSGAIPEDRKTSGFYAARDGTVR